MFDKNSSMYGDQQKSAGTQTQNQSFGSGSQSFQYGKQFSEPTGNVWSKQSASQPSFSSGDMSSSNTAKLFDQELNRRHSH